MSLMEKDQRSHGLTPAVKTAEFPPSSISSSSSSVVALPAVVDTKQKVTHPHRRHTHSGGTSLLSTHWSPAAGQCVLCSCPGSRLGPRCTWSSPPQTSWPGWRAEGEGTHRCQLRHFVASFCQYSVPSSDSFFVWSWRLLVMWMWNYVTFFWLAHISRCCQSELMFVRLCIFWKGISHVQSRKKSTKNVNVDWFYVSIVVV